MPMRGGSRDALVVSPRAFHWNRALTATLRHSTLPWGEPLKATSLQTVQAGPRDRLSLLAQFAAHQAALRFAGLADAELDPSEWRVVQQRGNDARLVRIAANSSDPAVAPPVLTLAQGFAEIVHAPELDVFRQSWARAEAVYVECFTRLRQDAAADLRWTRRSAVVRVLSPGPDVLETLASGRHTHADTGCIESLRAIGRRVFVIEGGSILRYAALEELKPLIGAVSGLSEAEVVERIAASGAGAVFVLVSPESLDGGSKRVAQMLGSLDGITCLWPDAGAPTLPVGRRYVVGPTLDASARASRSEVESLVEGDDFDAFLKRGVVPASRDLHLREPARSYLSVLALLGDCVPREIAERLLAEFTTDVTLDDLLIDGVIVVEEGLLRFEPSAAEIARLLRPASRGAVCGVAAHVLETCGGNLLRAAVLYAEAGESQRAVGLLEQVDWNSDDELIAVVDPIARGALPQPLVARLAHALVRAGRYRDARELAGFAEGEARELILAHAERRTGDYEKAMGRLERLAGEPDADVMRAEILYVLRRENEARAVLASPRLQGDRAEFVRYLVLGTRGPIGSRCLSARVDGYEAVARGDNETAFAKSREAEQFAPTVTERIDAHLDVVYSLFHAGRWDEARRAALEALTAVEETQGDRAAGGLLFLLAYLCADDGQWVQAAQRLGRLRHYYGTTQDARHLDELDLLTAHLDFSRGLFDQARRTASLLLERSNDLPIAEAAALIVDEIDWVHHREIADRPIPGNAGFRERHLHLRGGHPPEAAPVPRQFRLALRAGDRATAERIARAAGIVVGEIAGSAEVELRMLRALATADFPPSRQVLDLPWRYAIRNRLGHWTEFGSMPPAGKTLLDAAALDPPPEWIACSDRELLQVEGCARWSAESRAAVAAAFRSRSELQRLRRLTEQQEEASQPRVTSAAGILGESAAIRHAVARMALVARRDVPVCILGESGTGKELAARAIHGASPRRHKTFTAVNCAALPENLIESELFGHVRGAFTGADRDRTGLVESTDAGTLFLDEIGEMPLVAQAKLLRFLQDGEFRRVGEAANRSADVRVVAATNRKLEEAVEEGKFREDLYYRIRGVELTLPPLRDRGGDILLLAAHFLASERETHKSGPSRLSDEVETIFLSYGWPGNVRELQNAVRGAHAVSGDAVEVTLEHLPERLRRIPASRVLAGSYQDAVTRFRRELIERALAEANGNQNRAAASLKMSRQALGYQIRELGIMTSRRAGSGV